MARIVTEKLVIQFSKLVKDSEDDNVYVLTPEIIESLVESIQSSIDPSIIVEFTSE